MRKTQGNAVGAFGAFGAFGALGVASGLAFGACAEQRHAAGDECLKDVDCISGVCVAQTCGELGPTFDAPPPPSSTTAVPPVPDAATGLDGAPGSEDAPADIDGEPSDR
jgi:hypothetical protein